MSPNSIPGTAKSVGISTLQSERRPLKVFLSLPNCSHGLGHKAVQTQTQKSVPQKTLDISPGTYSLSTLMASKTVQGDKRKQGIYWQNGVAYRIEGNGQNQALEEQKPRKVQEEGSNSPTVEIHQLWLYYFFPSFTHTENQVKSAYSSVHDNLPSWSADPVCFILYTFSLDP